MIILTKIATFAVISLAIYLLIALGLTISQFPRHPIAAVKGLDFSRQVIEPDRPPASLETLQTGEGKTQSVRLYPMTGSGGPLVVLVHGSGWHGLQFDQLARALQPFADIVVPDLRGHGPNAKRRGDVDYIGQLEDDLADLIISRRKPGQRVVLAGHSSGGGLVVRFAGGIHRDLIDAAVLLAPFLKYNAPTTRQNAGGWAHTLTRRIIGLSMLNALKITALNHLTILEFAFPQVVLDGPLGATATTAYSFRMNTGFSPRADYLADIANLPEFLLIAGTEDEAFVATGYAPLMQSVTDQGRYLLIEGISHLDVVNVAETAVAISDFLRSDNDG